MGASVIRITLRRSAIGTKPRQRQTLKTLGLRRIGCTVEVADSPAMRGKIRTVAHLVDTER